jgi:predicted Zn-dependent peptidase
MLSILGFGPRRASAADPAAPAIERPAIFDRIEEFRLGNGMLFLLLPRHDVPLVAGRIRFRVGNVDCPAGESGIAHMFEHMAFQGTDVIGTRDRARELAVEDSVKAAGRAVAEETARGSAADTTRLAELQAELERLNQRQWELTVPNEFSRLYDRYSLNCNAWTSSDFTEYETDVPSNNLEVWMLMESERIQHPSFRGFYRERSVVMEERHEGEDDPATMARELLYSIAYRAHPYRLPVIGYMSDLEALSQEAAERFRATYYVPGNAVGALIGDFDPARAKQLLQAYFGDIPPGPPPPAVNTVEPPQYGMRRAVHRQGTERELAICFPGFPPADRRSAVLTLLADVLSRDITSRLDRRLDIQEHAAREVWAWASVEQRYPGLLTIHATPLEGFTNEQVEQMIWEELARVVTEPVTASKLQEIKDSRRKRFYRGLTTNPALADLLLDGQMIYGDWRKIFERMAMIESVTADEVTDLAGKVLQRDQATVTYLEPEATDAAANGGAR